MRVYDLPSLSADSGTYYIGFTLQFKHYFTIVILHLVFYVFYYPRAMVSK
jgi:hypothetical protein